ncbi:Mediator of RNA polymerase II transcription subunit 31 [Mortierella alpina]|nr:Mediator of RNA polymerase II transcription subunit 31 [Mortierella alpina]
MSQADSAAPSPAPPAASTALQTEDEYEQLKRFQIELEFVQCLSSPWYLHCTSKTSMATSAYHRSQDAFVRYLDYLQYFRKPEYAKFIIYPHCLHFLSLLQHKSFRDQLAKQDTATFVHERQYYHWQYLRNQENVVRMEIMPDGSMVKLKNEVAQDSPTPAQAQGLGLEFSSGPEHGADGQAAQRAILTGTASASAGVNGTDTPTPNLL